MFYIEKDNEIVLFDENKQKLVDTLLFMPQYQNLEIKETQRPIEDFMFSDTEEFKEQKKQKERERLDMLCLTAADVERAIYEREGLDFDDIIKTLETSTIDIDIKALKIELKANNFYRGNPYINQIGTILGYDSDELDYLFENKKLPEKEISYSDNIKEV